MKYNYHYETATVPTAFVTKGKQRVKQYGNTVYLKNGDEFEIELFNPTQFKILAKIKLDGNYISTSGIVLRPAERVHLERYLDDARKFMLDTYTVDGNNPSTERAIQKNGLVEVEFYEQSKPITYKTSYSSGTWWYGGYSTPTYTAGNNSINVFNCSSDDANLKFGTLTSDEHMTQCMYMDARPIETGRVEKGSHSEQDFNYDSTSFNSHYTWKSEWKILPNSQKAFAKEDIKVFCNSCGAKRKKSSHKFCPHCGEKF